MLTEKDAVEIYKMKIALQNQINRRSARANALSMWGKTSPVAKTFGIKPRTVKYIWNRQTWAHATKHLWANEAEQEEATFLKSSSKVESCHDLQRVSPIFNYPTSAMAARSRLNQQSFKSRMSCRDKPIQQSQTMRKLSHQVRIALSRFKKP
jgi:hypothetical protein